MNFERIHCFIGSIDLLYMCCKKFCKFCNNQIQ